MKMIHNIVKSFTQPLSTEEMEQVEAWKNTSAANLKAMQDYIKLNSASNELKTIEPFDEDKAWQRIANTTKIGRSKSTVFYRWVSAAAAILIIALATTLIWRQSISNDTPTIYTTTDHKQTISLADGSNVILDKNSALEVIDDRSVQLQGRAYFSVKKTTDTKKFVVSFDGGKVVVLGTAFTVLKNDDALEVNVEEGHVRLEYQGRSIDMHADDVVKLMGNNLALAKDTYVNSDSWKNGVLTFDDDPIEKVIEDLRNHFKVTIAISPTIIESVKRCYLTSSYKDESLDNIFAEWKSVYDIKYTKQGSGYRIDYFSCNK